MTNCEKLKKRFIEAFSKEGKLREESEKAYQEFLKKQKLWLEQSKVRQKIYNQYQKACGK